MLDRIRNRFLRRLAVHEDTAERLRVERVLASARVFLTAASLVALYVDPTEPSRYAGLAYGIVATYLGWGVAVLVASHRLSKLNHFPEIVHLLDIGFPVTFMLFTEGPNSPFFSFLLFVVFAAAFRWGLPETAKTVVALVAFIVFEAVLLSDMPQGWLAGQYDINRFVIRVSYLVTLGLLFGYLGEQEQQWRAESAAISRLLASMNAENGMRACMQKLLGEMLRIFRARRALMVLREESSNRMFVYYQKEADGYAEVTEVGAEARAQYHFPIKPAAWYAVRKRRGWKFWAIDSANNRWDTQIVSDLVTGMPEMEACKSMAAVSLHIGEEWSGRLLLDDAVTGPETTNELRFLQNAMKQVAPALYSVFLVRRLRSRAGAIERARVARELHDGAIQSLIAVEMQLDVLRRKLDAPEKAEFVAGQLSNVQEILRQQVTELRMLMQQMKPVDSRPEHLLDHMAEMVDRFRRDTGIAAQFVTRLDEVQMPSRTGRELIRIVQEALVNIRKHSGATSVQVRFGVEDGCWRLGIVDNGRGFDFSGRMNLEELDAARRGPGIIKERVRSLGGDLLLQSTPGNGSELLIRVPQRAQAAYA